MDTGTTLRRLESIRILQTASTVEYELILEEICSTTSCEDSQAVANALYQQVTDELRQVIDSGAFTTMLQQNAQALSVDALLSTAVGSGDFGSVVVAILGLLTNWYPDWVRGGYCVNDGNEPLYMSLNPTAWLYSTRAECCGRYFNYEYIDCMGNSLAPSGLFYPNWEGNEFLCLSDGNEPSYMRNKPDTWLYPDIESCCQRYYGWAFNDCVVASGGMSMSSSTRKWYANFQINICVQDCIVDAVDPTCGGLAKSSDQLFETPDSCCEVKLSWVARSVCVDESNHDLVTGSSQWYVDYEVRFLIFVSPQIF